MLPRLRFSPLLAASVLLAAAAGVSALFASVALPGISMFVPMAMIIASAAQAATGVVMLATYVRSPLRSTAFLALTYVCASVLTFAQSAVVPLTASSDPLVRISPTVSAWFYVAWHVGFSVCALAYVRMRADERELARAGAQRLLARYAAAFAAATAVVLGACIVVGTRFPQIAIAVEPGYFRESGIGAAAFAVSLAATIVFLSRRHRDHVELALALALLALALDVGLHLVDDRRFVVTWYVARLFSVGASAFVLIAAVRDLLHWRERAGRLQELLADESRRAGRHAARLDTLWRLGSSTLDDDAFLAALIEEAGRVLRAGIVFHGVIGRVDGAEIALEVVNEEASVDARLRSGDRFAVNDSMLGVVLREGRTVSSSDVRADPRFASVRSLRDLQSRAAIGTPFRVGATAYVIGFATVHPFDEPFSAQDHAYVETLASFCATRLHQRAQLDRLRYQTEHDPLTGVYNRATFRGRGFAALRENERSALVVLDVDHFRQVNDALGHHIGDAVLVEIAARLGSCLREREVLARLGSDTFGLLLRDAGDRGDVERRMEHLVAAFREPFGTGDREGKQRVAVTASFGVAIAPDDGNGFEQLLARADAAVIAAKVAGRARWSFFDQRVEERLASARSMQTELAEALVRDQLVLHFQPTVEIASGRIAGAEALIRWQHPERGMIAPADFIPFAEQHGMIGAIGDWVMRETVRRSHAWRRDDPRFRVWFNLSAVELSDPMLIGRLATVGDDLAGIGVEITETAAMRNVHETARTLNALRDAGLLIALDDFGTGYSSLAHLKRLPIDVVKIDRTFIDGIPGDPHDTAIVEAVASIAQRYGFETVAEGVENLDQVALLAMSGCTYGQGFAYARPMPADEFTAWLAERNIAQLRP